jgi:hypothetical protein
VSATVIGALRRFLPAFLDTAPPLSQDQRRALWALTHCRTPALGGNAFACADPDCGRVHFAWHSCNHKACPQCGRHATARWVARELAKRVRAPYFLVTFTLPAELRGQFFGPHARRAYDLFFTAVARALSEKLATAKGLRAVVNGFTAVLHTWTQRLEFHPHIHCLVPGAGLNGRGQFVRVRKPDYLMFVDHLKAAFRQQLYRLLKAHHWPVDPGVWSKEWNVQIQPVGTGGAAVKYLGTYVARTALRDERLVAVEEHTVTFRWKNRAHDRIETLTLPGLEFVRRYLRHVLPQGLRSVRYYGFCHPAAKANRLRVQCHSGWPVQLGAPTDPVPAAASSAPPCPFCGEPTHWIGAIGFFSRKRGPPGPPPRPPTPARSPWPQIAA